MFSTKEEFILALMEGRKFRVISGDLMTYDKTLNNSPFRIGGCAMDACFNWFNEVTEVFTNWYDDPASVGKLCWFWDDSSTDYVVVTIFEKYTTTNIYPYETNTSSYSNARLLTSEELAVLGGIQQIKNK